MCYEVPLRLCVKKIGVLENFLELVGSLVPHYSSKFIYILIRIDIIRELETVAPLV